MMICFNTLLWNNYLSNLNIELDKNLLMVINQGMIQQNNLLLLKYFSSRRKIPTSMKDDIDKEVFINNFHSDNYIENTDINVHWIQMLEFCNQLIKKLPIKKNFHTIIILSQTEYGINFKMHTKGKTNYLNQDLNQYNQGILTFTI